MNSIRNCWDARVANCDIPIQSIHSNHRRESGRMNWITRCDQMTRCQFRHTICTLTTWNTSSHCAEGLVRLKLGRCSKLNRSLTFSYDCSQLFDWPPSLDWIPSHPIQQWIDWPRGSHSVGGKGNRLNRIKEGVCAHQRMSRLRESNRAAVKVQQSRDFDQSDSPQHLIISTETRISEHKLIILHHGSNRYGIQFER